SYVHRIGRTARAGKSGIAYGFCDESESGYLVGIERLIGFEVPRDEEHRYHYPAAIPKPGQKPGKIKDGKSSGGRSNNSRNRRKPNNSGGGGRNSRPNRGGGGNQGSNRSRGQGNRGGGGNQGSNRSRGQGNRGNQG
ncbi:hypothetical protein N9Y01_00805, partial [Candidatus Poseidonia alphae]|nr:hypothetical protein [Candidatus Poseidonia alphae]